MSGEDTPTGEQRPAKYPNGGSPSWEPYQSPGSRRGSILRLLRRYAFSITLVAAVLGVGALIYFSPKRLSPEQSYSEPASTSALNTTHSTLSVYSEPTGASVIVGSDTVGVTPLESHRVQSGTYLVSVAKEDYADRDTAMTLAADQSIVYTPQLRQKEPPSSADRDVPQARSTTEDFRPAPSPDRSPEEASNQESYASGLPAASRPQGTSQEQEPNAESSTDNEADSLVTGSLELRSTPESAAVELNGYRVGSTPMSLDQVAAGTHEITFARSGYETLTRRVEVKGEDNTTVEVSLKAQTGYLRVLVRPWGSIYVNDQRRAEGSDVWYETQLQTGTYTVTARHPALGEKERAIEVVPSDTQSVVLDLRDN